MTKFLSGALGLAAGAVLLTGPALALDSSWDAMSKAGTHQFYVWCTGASDSEQTAEGATMEDAQAKLAAQVGNSCWPIWQGLVN